MENNILSVNYLMSQGKNAMSISRLTKNNQLGNLGYGYYTNKPVPLILDSDSTMKKIIRILDRFPFPPERAIFSSISLNFCINQTISSTTYIVEVEKEYSQMVFNALKAELSNHVLYKPTKEEKMNYWQPNTIYVVDLYSKSPTIKSGMFTIEKLIVDLLFDEEIYSLYSGLDIEQAVEVLCTHYTLNYKTLFAYASRRGKKDVLFQKIANYLPSEIKEVVAHD